MVTSDTHCAALDQGGGVRFTPDTFAIYSCAPLPASYQSLIQNGVLYTQLTTAASRICKSLPVYVDLDASALATLESLPVPVPVPVPIPVPVPVPVPVSGPGSSPATAQQQQQQQPHLPWFLINAATLKNHCVIGTGSPVDALLVILQRPWCILEVCCCADPDTIAAVRDFARLAAQGDPRSYDAAIRLLDHEYRAREVSAPASASALVADRIRDRNHDWDYWVAPQRCSEKALVDIYAATTLTRSYNRFWLPLICSCAVYLDLSVWEVVRRICADLCVRDGDAEQDAQGNGDRGGDDGKRVDWIELYRGLLGRIGDWVG
ncbi:hypothetical protein BDW59DRAFT_68250 [Aspergillus cavernicola]|uniref:Uncharacterized protein n=1 Tax=Aspergillus cavernicola TaxID=176166 RepID=A0ABR4IDU4_9EURO